MNSLAHGGSSEDRAISMVILLFLDSLVGDIAVILQFLGKGSNYL